MSTFKESKTKCAVCDNTVAQRFMMSSNSFSYADLDFRPAGMMRMAMSAQLNYCPHCGYVSSDVGELVYEDVKKYVKSSEYQNIVKNYSDETAKKFYLFAMIREHYKNYESAQYNYLRAAWFYDDVGEEDSARQSRLKSIDCYSHFDSLSIDDYLVLIDMYRRINDFETALKEIEIAEKIDLKNNENKDNILKVITFQKELCIDKDDSCYSIGDALSENHIRRVHKNISKVKTLEEQYADLMAKVDVLTLRHEVNDKREKEIQKSFEEGKVSKEDYDKEINEIEKELTDILDELEKINIEAEIIRKKLNDE